MRITRRRYQSAARRRVTLTPYVVAALVLTIVNTYLFHLPMAHRK